jgi:flagellar FliL protein
VTKFKLVLIIVLVALVAGGVCGAGAWWYFKVYAAPQGKTARVARPEPVVDTTEYKYVSLEKVVVMLRSREGEPLSHYLSVDLVFKTPVKREKTMKEHLPLLRSLAVRELSSYTLDKAGLMTVDQVAHELNVAFSRSYAASHTEKPFAEAMIGRLIIE